MPEARIGVFVMAGVRLWLCEVGKGGSMSAHLGEDKRRALHHVVEVVPHACRVTTNHGRSQSTPPPLDKARAAEAAGCAVRWALQ